MPKIELISFKLCPFVQRSVITLKQKNIDFDITYIDLQSPPDWFLEISPLGKVPVLKAENEIIFESAVINEYVDETTPPSLHPQSAIEKAKHRAWIEFGSALMMDLFAFFTAETEDVLKQQHTALSGKLQYLENVVTEGGYFNGQHMSLIDTAYAPLFMRMDLLNQWLDFDLYEQTPKIKAWAANLASLPAVQQSVVPEFPQMFENMLRNRQSYILKDK
ncbi:glutathione S-transferase family protein [Candidatus Albibeggiatoa sp. nov. NOAA]|uniref:glutathione S-transferase family protein n=1 Tax=Candidatus Albibeggiatoa sp. nov. NOAA TaxID=3162724 RepID=UPI0032F54A57|nr:glutathione S-transferase family protein [Thiotrichaceae bacterium]